MSTKRIGLAIGPSMRVSRAGLEASPLISDVRVGERGRTLQDELADAAVREAAASARLSAQRFSTLIGSAVAASTGVGYIDAIPGLVQYSATYGVLFPWDVVVTDMSISVGAASTCAVDVYASGVAVAGASVSLAAGTSGSAAITPTVIPAGSILGLGVSSGAALTSLFVSVGISRYVA